MRELLNCRSSRERERERERGREEGELLRRLTRSVGRRRGEGGNGPKEGERGREGGRPFKVGKMRGTSGIRLDAADLIQVRSVNTLSVDWG